MKTRRQWLLLLLCITWPLAAIAQPVQAHAADQYLHEITLHLRPDFIEVVWEFTPGPFLSGTVWASADRNENETIEPQEQADYLSLLLSQFSVQIGSQIVDEWEITDIHWGATIESLSTIEDNIRFSARAPLPPLNGEFSLFAITNGFFPYYSITLFSLSSDIEWAFNNVEQTNQSLNAELTAGLATGSTSWSSEAPDFSVFSGDQQRIPGTNQTIRDRLNQVLVRAQDESGVWFTLGAILVSLLLGMLHAFTPGHGKSVVAAYMIGAKGNWLQGVTLGLIVSVTHTLTVILVGLAVLFGSRLFQIEQVFPILEIVSGLLVLVLGIVLFIQRYRFAKKARDQKDAPPPEQIEEANGETRVIIRQSVSEEAAPHPHIGPKYVPRHRADITKLEWRTLLALGTSGGIVPCPDAVAIFIIAASLNLLQLGVFMIIAFSIGISTILMVLGGLIARGKRTLAKIQGLQAIITHAPLISAAVLLLVGIFLTGAAFNRYQPLIVAAFSRPAESVPLDIDAVEIAFLADDENGLVQLFTMQSDGSQVTQRTVSSQSIKSYLLSPQPDVLFLTTFDQNRNTSQVWEFDLNSGEMRLRIEQSNASIYNLHLTPDRTSVLFEHTDLQDTQNPYLVTNIYQWELSTDTISPLLSNTNLVSFQPAFSPDQRLFTYFNPNANRYEIYAVDGSRRLTLPSQIGQQLRWSDVETDYILYQDVSGEGKNFALQTYLYNLATYETLNLSEETGLDLSQAFWVPGEFALFLTGRATTDEPGSRIYQYDLTTRTLTELREFQPSLPRDLVISPDGCCLLYEQYGIFDRETYSGIWRLDRDGNTYQLSSIGRMPQWLIWEP